jgi:hypothetical protein
MANTKKKVVLGAGLVLAAGAWYLILFGPGARKPDKPHPPTAAAASAARTPGDTPRGTDAAFAKAEVAPAAGGRDHAKEKDSAPPSSAEVDRLLEVASALVQRGKPESVPKLGRDPFQGATPAEGAEAIGARAQQGSEPGDTEETPDLSFLLSSIIWDQQRPMAVINRMVVGKGDSVGTGIKVAEIEPTCVVLGFRYWGRDNEIRLDLNTR